jgi:hypothetical protein
MAPKIYPSAQIKNNRRRIQLTVGNELRFVNVGIDIPVFSKSRGRCEWCQSRRIRTVQVAQKEDQRGLESRPYS